MYNFTFEGQGTNTYLVYEIKAQDAVDSMSLGMLTNNKISGLANTIFTQMNSTKYIKYNVSSKVSAKQFFSGAVNKKRLLGVFSGIVKGLLSSEEYMIDVKSIILDLEYIFVDVTSCEAVLICLPIDNSEEEKVDAATFFKNIMFTTQFDQTENCDHVAKIMNFINSMPVFSLVEFKKLLEELEHNEAKQASVPSVQPPRVVPAQTAQNSTAMPQVKTVVTVQPQPQLQPQIHQHMPPQPYHQAPQPQPQGMGPDSTEAPKSGAGDNPVQAHESQEKKMSMLTLLTHYSKENATIYKEQKAAAKENRGETISGQKPGKKAEKKAEKNTKVQNKNSKKTKAAAKAVQPQFAIPRQSEQIVMPKAPANETHQQTTT